MITTTNIVIIITTITIILIIISITQIILKTSFNNYIYNNLFITNLLNNNKKNKKLINNKDIYLDFYNISIFKSNFEMNNYMILIKPQNYYFFIENNKLIYHPNSKNMDGLLKQYSCDIGFELAYNLQLKNNNFAFPRIICHRSLSYLKSIYKFENLIHYKYFHELQTPINAITLLINDMITN